MLIRPIKYTDYADPPQEHTEKFYFHLSAREFTELQLSVGPGGFEAWYKKAVAEKDEAGLFELFKRIILTAYGERSADGKNFRKSPEIRAEFESHAAFDALFDEFLRDGTGKVISDFMKGALPEEVSKGFDDPKLMKQVRDQMGAVEATATEV